jgi:uncharacterized spore protein YtfJ
MSSAVQILHSIGERFQAGGTVKNVFGDPIVIEGKTIIPVACVKYGFGAGGGGSTSQEHSGGGGGGGLRTEPVGVVEITASETRFITFFDPKRVLVTAGIGFILGMMFSRMRRKRKERR